MATINYGALLKVNGVFLNKDKDLFMDASNTGYVLEKARYADESIYDKEVDIQGNFYVYVGDEDFMLTFYKGYFYIISHGLIIGQLSYSPFISETLHIADIDIHVEHLDSDYKVETYSIGLWKDFVKKNWCDVTGDEKLSELQGGKKEYRRFLRRAKCIARGDGVFKYRTARWLAKWEHNGDKYEVIFGYGIDPSTEVWNTVKQPDYNGYDFTRKEVAIIDEWFKNK